LDSPFLLSCVFKWQAVSLDRSYLWVFSLPLLAFKIPTSFFHEKVNPMKCARFLILAVFYTLYLVSPQILADSPREEAGKARREQLKNEHEFHKKMLEQ
jgi:hypothetical protein